ncbi:MAG: 3'-5' exonuclease [Puniceicoccales bacterium]|jgi:DNA polymerase-3 subunit epsilon|nr:3'-5' exonuclease [Puniceicoccales bacterium]
MPHWKDIPIQVIDFEGSSRTGIVEYGVATLHQGEITGTVTRLCAPSAPIPFLDTQCHGLRDADLAGTLPLSADWELFSGLRRSGLLAAHHAPTEHNLLRLVWPYPGAMPDHARSGAPAANDWGPWIDTHRIAIAWHPQPGDHKLSSLIGWFNLGKKLAQLTERYCPPARCRYHCALYDALASALLLRHLCAQPDKLNVTLETLVLDSLGGTRQAERMQGELGLF